MKQYEAETCNAMVDTSRPTVVRLDGHWCVVLRANTQHQRPHRAHTPSHALTHHSRSFHTYTKGFRRPYDTRINAAMVATATDLLERFGAVTAYTESDEISLLWPPAAPHGVQLLPFNGRVQKVVSVTAGYASARFNKHMMAQTFDPQTEAALIARVEASEAHFDARVFSLPSTERLHGYMRWRALQDCRRNSISMLAQAHFSPAQLHGVDARTMCRMLLEDKGVDWLEQPAFFRYGSYVKKEEFTKQAFNPKTQQQVRRAALRMPAAPAARGRQGSRPRQGSMRRNTRRVPVPQPLMPVLSLCRRSSPAARAQSSAPSSCRTTSRNVTSCSPASGRQRARRGGARRFRAAKGEIPLLTNFVRHFSPKK